MDHNHGQRERQTERNTDMNTGLGGQTGRTEQSGHEKYFSFHIF
jgi:hypothetical protein